jgi:hypothetical protein
MVRKEMVRRPRRLQSRGDHFGLISATVATHQVPQARLGGAVNLRENMIEFLKVVPAVKFSWVLCDYFFKSLNLAIFHSLSLSLSLSRWIFGL